MSTAFLRTTIAIGVVLLETRAATAQQETSKLYKREGFVIIALSADERGGRPHRHDGTVINGDFVYFQDDFCMFNDDFELLQRGMINDSKSVGRSLILRIRQLDKIPFERYSRENCEVGFQQHSAKMKLGIEAYERGDIAYGDRMLVFGLENLACHNGVHQLFLTEEQISRVNDLAVQRLEISRKMLKKKSTHGAP